MNNILAVVNSNSNRNFWIGLAIISFLFAVFYITTVWKVFKKAGKPGWAALIPVYNSWVTYEIGGISGWWALISILTWAPVHSSKLYTALNWLIFAITIVLSIQAAVETGKRFGKTRTYTLVFLILLPFIGWPILAFGKAKYELPKS